MPLPCLAVDQVIEVPTEASLPQALGAAIAGQTIQVRGLAVGPGFTLPPNVTLRGCAGAQITDSLEFERDGGLIEGFEVSGSIVAHTSGTYTVRANRFVGDSTLPAVVARADEDKVSTAINLTVDGNWFAQRQHTVQAIAAGDADVHIVGVALTNNIFYGLENAVELNGGGLTGLVTAEINFNDFISNAHNIYIFNVNGVTYVENNVFYLGASLAVESNSPYLVDDDYYFAVIPYDTMAPMSGSFVMGDPMFVNWGTGDFHLMPGSPLIDKVAGGPAVPPIDYYGCPRPFGKGVDIGAVENQH